MVTLELRQEDCGGNARVVWAKVLVVVVIKGFVNEEVFVAMVVVEVDPETKVFVVTVVLGDI